LGNLLVKPVAINKLLSLFTARMDYLTQRQGVIGSNIASANTPGYVPKDLESFDSVLQKKMTGAPIGTLRTTNEKHLGGIGETNSHYKTSRMKDLYEVKPSGNAVVIEQQMATLSQVNSDYAVVTGLYKKMVGLLKTAIGHRG
jgi:flagellar basal-body rod protein FlgB